MEKRLSKNAKFGVQPSGNMKEKNVVGWVTRPVVSNNSTQAQTGFSVKDITKLV